MAVEKVSETNSKNKFDEANEELAVFFELNPHSSLHEDGNKILNPWGDSSLELILEDITEAKEILQGLFLPERYTAIWHKDTKNLEFIFTAYNLTGEDSSLKNRAFTFRYKNKDYKCYFGNSSDKLLGLAKLAKPISESNTDWRNLHSFILYNDIKQKNLDSSESQYSPIGEPVSFWIENLEWDEDAVLDLTEKLNFYMGYYDTQSPMIAIHSPKLENIKHQPQKRYKIDKFPDSINARPIDKHMLHYWNASRTGDPTRRFLNSYRIIEYASIFYLDKKVQTTICKILSSPHALDNPSKTTELVLSELMPIHQDKAPKLEAIVKEAVNTDILWEEIFRNSEIFSKSIIFDGGFQAEPLIKSGWQKEDFEIHGIGAFSKTIRGIRNALSHGMDSKTTKVITPTTHNSQRLQPWASLISVAAADIMLFKDSI